MGFEEELEAIVRGQQGNESLGEEVVQHILSVLKEKGTVGYLVFVAQSGDNGLVCLGSDPADLHGLAFAHRTADKLIDELIYGEECEYGDEG